MLALFSIFLVFLLAQGGQADICVENDRVYHLVEDRVDHTIYYGRDFDRTIGLNSDLYRGLYNRDVLQGGLLHRGIYDRDFLLNKNYYNRDYLINKGVYNKDFLLNKDVYNRDLFVNKGIYNKDILLNKNFYNRDYLINKGVYNQDFLLNRDVYNRDSFVNKGIYNKGYLPRVYRNVGDYKQVDSNVHSNILGRSEIDRTYRMDFFKDTFGIMKSRSECACVCPSSIPKGDLTDRIIIDVVQKDLLNKLWNNSQMPRLTLLGKRMKNAILHLVNSEVPIFQRHALIMSVFFFSYYPHNELDLDFCPFTKLIDASVSYKKYNDVSKVHEAIDVMGRTIYDSAQLMGSSVMFYGKCGLVRPDVTRHNCVGDGTVYQFEEIWDLEGGQLPSFYREVATELYHSEMPIDKLMAVIASAALTPQISEIVNDWNRYQLFEIINMLATQDVPACCCNFRMHRLQELMSIVSHEISRNTVIAKSVYSL